MTNEKIEALAKFLGEDQEDYFVTPYNENIYTNGLEEYLVLTNEEADEVTKEAITELVWAFNKDFIIAHSSALDYDKASEQIIEAIQQQCESGNNAMTKLIDNMDEFIEDAISSDGRGHFLSGYDGEENQQGNYFIYRTN